jgi:hypothetical protein
MTKNDPIAGESKFINCSRSVVTWLSVDVRKITISGKLSYPEMTSQYFFEKIWFWLII